MNFLTQKKEFFGTIKKEFSATTKKGDDDEMGYRLLEKIGERIQPICSVVQDDNNIKIAVRNITEKHILRKKGYEAIFADKVVVDFLDSDGVKNFVYVLPDKTLTVPIANYKATKPIKMAGRIQVGVSVVSFIVDKPKDYERPIETRIVKLK